MDNTEVITVLSLCTGYGGIELGLALALENPMRVVTVEVEAYALANLAAKAEQGKLAIEAMWPDLRTFPAERFRGCFDIITAGYPCQGESVAGKRLGKADPRWLWPHIARIIEAVRPVWFFGENVPGHLTLGFPTVYRSLRKMGYSVEAGLFTAAECGAPHRRERLFILAQHNGNGRRGFLRQTRQGQGRAQQRTNPDGQGVGNGGKRAPRELADTKRPEQGAGDEQETQAGIGWDRFAEQSWPARPGQPQYEWEQPRVVVGNTSCGRCKQPAKELQTGRNAAQQTDKRQTQSRLGRTVNGTSSRVDRLRLLGNGVVSQQAAKAFRILSKR